MIINFVVKFMLKINVVTFFSVKKNKKSVQGFSQINTASILDKTFAGLYKF